MFARHRQLRRELVSEPWALGAGFALALALITMLGRVTMLGFAIAHGVFHGFTPAHFFELAPELGHDIIVGLFVTLFVGGLLRVLPGRARVLALVLGYAILIAGSVLVIISVPIYAALQTTLQLTQLLLAGGVRDLFDSGLGIVPAPVFVLAFLLLMAACFSVPFFAKWLADALRGRSALRVALGLGVTTACAIALGYLAPEDSAQTLQTGAVYDFAVSFGRFYGRRHPRAVDMHDAPHFDASLMFAKPLIAVPTEQLVDLSHVPLHRPNVVLLTLESAAVRQTGYWNGRPQDTPRISELAQHGLSFDQYYSPSPVSMKSLFSLTCSSYPHAAPQAETYTNPSIDCQSISELLKDQGYRTGLFHSGHFSYTRKDAYFRNRHYDVMRDANSLQHRRHYPSVPWGADDRAAIDDALDWLDKGNQAAPFFLHVIFLAPHEPYVVHDTPEPFGTKTDVERYRNATLFIDGQVGRVWDAIKQRGKEDDTLFVIVGDHGESFGEHRGDFLHGGRIYDSGVHTPLLFVNPRLFSGKRSDRIGNHLDLVPTILDLIGLPKPPRHQGSSLLRGYKPHMLYFYADWQRHYLGLRDGPWKYIYDVNRERHELYDLDHDPDEHKNLAFQFPTQVEAYAQRVLAWESFYRELIPNYERYVDGQDACAGKDVCRLDELKPVLQHGIFRKDRSGSGFRLQLANQVFEHGLGVAPLSILRYNIRGDGYRRFKGAVGHHSQGGNANLSLKVSTEIYLDDRLIWSSGKLTADDPPKEFDLDVRDGALLELIGYDVDAEDWRDYIDWVEVRLER
jgi:arylsulfatase A-like enzyme